MKLKKQSDATYPLIFLMVDSTDHVSGKTGLSPTVTISKNGGTFASPSGAVTEIGNGLYKVAGNATDSNTLGELWVHATATGADVSDVQYQIVAFDPNDAVRMGLTALPNAAAAAANGLPVLGTNASAISFTAGMTVSNASGTALTLSSGGSNGSGLNCSGNGSGNGITASGGTTGDGIVGNATNGNGIRASTTAGKGLKCDGGTGGVGLYAIGGGTGGNAATFECYGGSGTNHGLELIGSNGGSGIKATGNGAGPGITAVGGATGDGIDASGGATSGKGIDANGTGGSADIEGNITGNMTGNVTGSVGSVTGAVGSVSGAVGSVTGNVGGNVVGSVASVTAGVTVTTNNDKTGYALSSAGVTAIWAEVMDGTRTAVQFMRGFAAALLGKSNSHAAGTPKYRNIADTKDVISATTDADGNRTAVTTDLT